MSDFLQEIARLTEDRVSSRKAKTAVGTLREIASTLPAPRGFARALNGVNEVRVIAELKQASPSAGVIRQELDIDGRVLGYVRGGASALSILTEEKFFHGADDILRKARAVTTLPLLRKDFILDGYQIEESAALGADAILLIVAMLSRTQLAEFLAHAAERSLDALVEVHDEGEADEALRAKAAVIGVNNRNLRTLQVDPKTAERVVPHLKGEGCVVVVESGVREPAQLPVFRSWGAGAVLIGEALMRENDAEAATRRFVEGGKA